MPLDDPAAAAGSGGSGGEEFKLLDIDGSTASPSYRNTAVAIAAADVPLAEKLSRLAFTGVNVVFSCGTLAVAKQIFNPANFTAPDAAAQEASRALPSWFAGKYQQGRVGKAMTQRVVQDTGVLMAASGLWYGIQFTMRKLRGEHDAVNVCVAGTISAGFLGATFFEPFKLQRVGIWGAVGGLLGYYGFREQQALRTALLARQQELEQKHMRVAPEQVRQTLEPKFLQELLQIEQKQRQESLKSEMQKHGVQVPAAGSSNSSSPDGKDGSGSSSGGAGSRPEQWAGADDNDGQWQKLLNSAPWLQDEDSKQ